jgi:multidrug efflux system outer membrane protein
MTLPRHLFISVAAVCLLNGCTMIPEYLQPDAPVAAKWPTTSADELSQDGQKYAGDITWQEFFKSPVLQKVIATALENNRDLRIAALNIEEARATYRIQRADLVPSVDGTLAGSRTRTPEDLSATGRAVTSSQYEANLGVTAFELDLFGRVRSLNESALEDYLATEEARRATQISLIAETANAYLQLLADQKALELTRSTLDAQQESYDLIAKSNALGAATKLTLSQARTTLEAAKANEALYTRRAAQDKNALILLMGTGDAAVLDSIESLNDVSLMEQIPVGLPSEVLTLRPDIRQAEHTLKSANAKIGAARAAFFPTISLTGSAGFASDALSSLFSGGAAGAWRFAPQITLPIFEGGRNIATLDASEVRKDIAVAGYEKSIQSAFRDVADALAGRATLSDQLQAQRDLVAAAQTAYDLSLARYKQGIDSYLNALDAQRSLYSAQQGEIQVQQAYLSNLIDLYKALGGGANE